jgi:hypothetical protein
MTFTIDRKNFDSPREAYDFVRKQRLIARLLRYLHVTRWAAVVQFQERSGDGWPHWHILCDLSHIAGSRPVDYKRLWRLWRDEWGIGGLDVSTEQQKRVSTPEHAINYITRYLVRPMYHIPKWFLNLAGCRLVMASKAVGRLTDGTTSLSEEVEDYVEKKERRQSRPLIDRLSDCHHHLHVFTSSRIRLDTGEIVPGKFIATVPGELRDLWDLPGVKRVQRNVVCKRGGQLVTRPVYDASVTDLDILQEHLSSIDVSSRISSTREMFLALWELRAAAIDSPQAPQGATRTQARPPLGLPPLP